MDREWVKLLGTGLLATLHSYQGPKDVKKVFASKIKEVIEEYDVSDTDSESLSDV
jgi:hypothetical protein